MENEQYNILFEAIGKVDKRIDDLERVTNAIKKDIGDDRVKIDNVVLSQEKLSGLVETMRGDTNNLSKKTEAVVKDAMTTAIQPAVDSMEGLRKEIKEKKTMIIHSSKIIDFIKSKLK